jgi:hypothetical protein
VIPLGECLAARDCQASDDPCFARVAGPYLGDAPFTRYRAACVAKRAACNKKFSDDFCANEVGIVREQVLGELGACLDQPCDAVGGCLKGAIRKYPNCK